MNGPLLSAGILALAAAAIHGIVGEVALLQRMRVEQLPATRMGGPRASMLLIRATWHFVTATFALAGLALLYASANTAAAHTPGIVTLTGLLFSTFTVFVLAGPILFRQPATLFRHPAPLGMTATAILIWWGASGL